MKTRGRGHGVYVARAGRQTRSQPQPRWRRDTSASRSRPSNRSVIDPRNPLTLAVRSIFLSRLSCGCLRSIGPTVRRWHAEDIQPFSAEGKGHMTGGLPTAGACDPQPHPAARPLSRALPPEPSSAADTQPHRTQQPKPQSHPLPTDCKKHQHPPRLRASASTMAWRRFTRERTSGRPVLADTPT